MTAIYTFRMIFRAFHGEPCPEAEELSHGHLYHAPEPTNPMTGEVEDTEVGFPGPEHHIAEREAPMKVAMGALAVLTIIGGLLQIPGVSTELHHFLEPTFQDSELYETLEPSVAQEWIGLLIGAVIGLTGIGIAWRIYGHGGKAEAIQARFGRCTRSSSNKWYFDEAINFLIVRPTAWLGRFCATHGRARVRQRRADRRLDRRGADAVGGRARDPVRLPALLRRAAADRLHRPGRLLPGLRMTIHLSILVFFPLFCGVLSAFMPRRGADDLLIGTVVPLAYAVMMIADFDTAGGLQHVTDDAWIEALGIRYKLGVDGLNLWLVALTAVVAFASADRGCACARSSAPACSRSTSGSARPRCSARSSRRTWRCSSSSST